MGTYMIVVAEGLTNANGEMLYDESAGIDAFGHKKLTGAGKYVRQQLEKKLKADPEITQFMKDTGMFAPGIYENPEVREVVPGHLVRAGGSSAFDVNFGYKTGAGAVFLLLEGKTGNTVVDVVGNTICYEATADAIKRREVDLDCVSLWEDLGICFGRKPVKFTYELQEVKGEVQRHL
jgi:6-phosphofructokinase 1